VRVISDASSVAWHPRQRGRISIEQSRGRDEYPVPTCGQQISQIVSNFLKRKNIFWIVGMLKFVK